MYEDRREIAAIIIITGAMNHYRIDMGLDFNTFALS